MWYKLGPYYKLQNEIFLGKITHMCRRWGTPQNFTPQKKQLLIKKLMKWGKKCKNFNINVVFFKIEKHTWRYGFTHVYLKSWWYDLQFLRIRVWHTKIGNYGSAFTFLTPTPHPAKISKNQNFEKIKKLPQISFYTCVP